MKGLLYAIPSKPHHKPQNEALVPPYSPCTVPVLTLWDHLPLSGQSSFSMEQGEALEVTVAATEVTLASNPCGKRQGLCYHR